MADHPAWIYRRKIIQLGKDVRARDARVGDLLKENEGLREKLARAESNAAEAVMAERRIARRASALASALERCHTWIKQLRAEREGLVAALLAVSIEGERKDGRLELQPVPGWDLLVVPNFAAHDHVEAAMEFALAVPGPGVAPQQPKRAA